MPLGPRGPGHRQLSLGMEGPLARRRTEEERRLVGPAEELGPGVDLGDVHQVPRADLDPVDGFAVGAQRPVVVHSAREIAVVGRRQFAPGHHVEVEDADGVLRGGDGLLAEGLEQARERRGLLVWGPGKSAATTGLAARESRRRRRVKGD